MIFPKLTPLLFCSATIVAAASQPSTYVKPEDRPVALVDSPAPQPGRAGSRQVTREQIAARHVATKQSLGKRQFGGGPSAVPSICGTVLGGRYLVKAVTTNDGGPFPANAPGYLYTDPGVTWQPGTPFALITSDMAAAHVYTLDTASGCDLLDLTLPGAKVRTDPRSVANGGSVTVEKTDSQQGLFEPYKCKADRTGALTCTVIDLSTSTQRTIKTWPYLIERSATATRSYTGTCYADASNCASQPAISFSLIPVS